MCAKFIPKVSSTKGLTEFKFRAFYRNLRYDKKGLNIRNASFCICARIGPANYHPPSNKRRMELCKVNDKRPIE